MTRPMFHYFFPPPLNFFELQGSVGKQWTSFAIKNFSTGLGKNVRVTGVYIRVHEDHEQIFNEAMD